MNNESPLEAEIQRELSKLGELEAPSTLLARVSEALEQRQRLPWYRQSWPAWPLGWRAVSLVFLMAIFATVCVLSQDLVASGTFSAALQQMLSHVSGLTILWNALAALGGGLVAVAQQLGPGFIVGCVAIAILAYAACVGLCTVLVRYTLSTVRRTSL
jgi:hypothetical protein